MHSPEQDDPSWRLDRERWDLLYGTAGDRAGGFFSGGAGEKGLRWSTAGGGFRGDIHERGLDIFGGSDEVGGTNVHALADFKKKSGDIGLQSGGEQLLNLHGEGSGLDDYRLGLTAPLGGGLSAGLHRDVAKGNAANYLSMGLREGNDEGQLRMGLDDDGWLAGAGGTLRGADGTSLTGSATLGAERFNLSSSFLDHGTRIDHATTGEWGRYVENSTGFSNGTDSVRAFDRTGEGARSGLDYDHDFGRGRGASLGVAQAQDGATSLSIGGRHPLGDGSIAGRLGGSFGGPGNPTVDLGVDYKDAANTFGIKGHEGGPDARSLSMAYEHAFGDHGKLGANLGMAAGDRGTSLTYGLEELYGNQHLAHTMQLGGANGPDGDSFHGSASGLARLGGSDFYAGAFGRGGVDPGQDPSFFAGGNLTYMPSSHVGLTAAAGYGSSGFEGGLQADFYKKGVGGAKDLLEARNHPMFSVFLRGHTGDAGGLDPFFGEADRSRDVGPGITLGIGTKF